MENEDLFGVIYLINSFTKLDCRKRLQKAICIGKYNKEISYPFSFNFIRFHYGPYSFELKEMMDKLILGGYIREEFARGKYSYSLTDSGKVLFLGLNDKIGKDKLNKLNKLVSSIKGLNVSDLTIKAKTDFNW